MPCRPSPCSVAMTLARLNFRPGRPDPARRRRPRGTVTGLLQIFSSPGARRPPSS